MHEKMEIGIPLFCFETQRWGGWGGGMGCTRTRFKKYDKRCFFPFAQKSPPTGLILGCVGSDVSCFVSLWSMLPLMCLLLCKSTTNTPLRSTVDGKVRTVGYSYFLYVLVLERSLRFQSEWYEGHRFNPFTVEKRNIIPPAVSTSPKRNVQL